MQELAKQIADLIFKQLDPEIHKAMVERIISVATEKWRFQFSADEKITAMINNAVDQALKEKYKPVLDYIADKKAREKTLKRAEQNGIAVDEILPLFGKVGEP